MHYTRLSALIAGPLLTACISPIPQPKAPPLKVAIEIMQPKVDLPHAIQPRGMNFNVDVRDAPEPNTIRSVHQGAHTAIECNAERTKCKHAVVFPVVRYTLTRTGNDSARLQGALIVTVGRSITDKVAMDGVNAEFTTTISPDVEVIEEGTFSYPLAAELKLGRPYVVAGRLGTRVTFELQNAPHYPYHR